MEQGTVDGNMARERLHLATLVDDMVFWGNATAIVEHRGVRRFATSYAELSRLARRFAAELDRRGIGSGERVLLWGTNGATWVACYFGCVLRGVLPVPLDASGSAAFAEQVARDVSPRLVVGDGILLEQGLDSHPKLPLDTLATLLPPVGNPEAAPTLSPDASLQILFTSGTTGTPKGIVHTHRNLLASLLPIAREIQKYRKYERLVHPLRFLHTLPLSHVFGQFMGLWLPPLLGAEVHYEERVTGGRLALSLVEDRVNVLAAVPRTLDLLRAYLIAEDPHLPQRIAAAAGQPIARRWWRFRDVHRRLGLRFWAAVCGGATLPAQLEQFWTTMGFAMIQGYGLTETSAIVTLNHPFKPAQGSVGAPLPGRSLRVAKSGELEVRGEMVATRSWVGGHLVERADPWLRTGDLATIGEDGRLRFQGRSSQRLVTAAGLNVYLEDVEAALSAEPALREVVAIPIASEHGDEPGAVVVAPGGSAAADSAVAAANASLAPHQRVRRWWLWPGIALPRTGSGKLARRQLQDWVAEQMQTAERPGEAGAEADPVIELLRQLGATGGPPDDAARLSEDWGLDSMGRVALAAALEEQAAVPLDDAAAVQLQTLGDVRALLRGSGSAAPDVRSPVGGASGAKGHAAAELPAEGALPTSTSDPLALPQRIAAPQIGYRFPRWPWAVPVALVRAAFVEGLLRPLVRVFGAPRVMLQAGAFRATPVLAVANHRTAMDVPLLLFALPGRVRRRIAVAMSGEMLEGWRRSWSLRPLPPALAPHRRWWGPLAAFAVKALLNVFPLPATTGFRSSFAHAGRALDRGYSVLIFPEGRRSKAGELLPFKGGAGILAKESYVAVVPIGLTIPERVRGKRRRLSVAVGCPLRPDPNDSAEQMTEQMRLAVRRLLGD